MVNLLQMIFSSPGPLGSQGELIVDPYSGIRRCAYRQQCLKIFSEIAWPIKAKFYVEWGMKVYINHPGHMIKMAAMPNLNALHVNGTLYM